MLARIFLLYCNALLHVVVSPRGADVSDRNFFRPGDGVHVNETRFSRRSGWRDGSRSVANSPTAAATTSSSQVSISEAAREAARNDTTARPGLKLSAAVMQWFNKDFSPEILDEAKARLEDIRDIRCESAATAEKSGTAGRLPAGNARTFRRRPRQYEGGASGNRRPLAAVQTIGARRDKQRRHVPDK